ncbi:MAG: diguanylate cyclase [Betaproteobacteria bacterium]|nr:diguanylate cyclase [Betaproteobacteria bacterium]
MRDASPGTPAVDRLTELLVAVEAPRDRLPLLLALADAVSGVDARRAAALAHDAAELALSLADLPARAEALFVGGRCADLNLEHGHALAQYDEALRAFEATGDDRAAARTLRAISFVHDTLGDFSRALDSQFRALELDERTGDQGSQAATLRTIGVVYSRSDDPRTGLDYYRRSLALATRPEDAIERGKTLNNIGINLKNLGQYAEAHAALVEAHQLFVALGLPLQQSATLNNLGLVLEKQGDAAGAERTLRAALDLSESTGYRLGVAHANLALGRLCLAQGRHAEALLWLTAALADCERYRLKPTEYECHEALADYHERAGDHGAALRHFRRFHALEREVQTEAARDKLRALTIQLELKAARRETELERERQGVLTRANADLDALNVALTEANLQKTMLLDQLERQTYEDALTGLANRRRLDQRLADEFALALRHGRPLAVAMADLDHFKAVNDRFSHAVGDAALRATARLLASQVRHTDLVARFGGEEFVIVLVETDDDAARRVCEKLRAAVANHGWTAIHPGLSLTLSIGLCADTSVPSHDRMLAMADRNLYSAKAAGRNRVVG